MRRIVFKVMFCTVAFSTGIAWALVSEAGASILG
jgi:hypothetical protein